MYLYCSTLNFISDKEKIEIEASRHFESKIKATFKQTAPIFQEQLKESWENYITLQTQFLEKSASGSSKLSFNKSARPVEKVLLMLHCGEHIVFIQMMDVRRATTILTALTNC